MLLILLFVMLIAFIMIAYELLVPRQSWPQAKRWWRRALLINCSQIIISYVTGIGVDQFFSRFALMHLGCQTWMQIVIGYLSITFFYYWWHRLRHTSLWWNVFHQLHHSPVRLEILTAFYKHPLEIIADGILSSAILYLLLGLSPSHGAMVIAITGIAELFYHWNIKTPYWLGFIFQRPESHCIHHQRGKHHYNYSDLPIWDMLFGTFYNPKQNDFECGFANEKELRLKEIMLFKNVNNQVTHER